MKNEPSIVVVGASVAGLSFVEALRSEGFSGNITLVGKENHLPYNRPPLSKQILAGKWEKDRLRIMDQSQIVELGVHLLLGKEVSSVNFGSKLLELCDGSKIPYSKLVVATGLVSKELPNPQNLAGIYSLRSIDDSESIEIALQKASRVAIVGAGVLGCEIASGLVQRGFDVSLIGRSSTPKIIPEIQQISQNLQQLMELNNVHSIMDSQVSEVIGNKGTVTGLLLTSGQIVETDLVITCIGSTPSVSFLEGANFDISDGVLCDERGFASEDVYAIGDVARWLDSVNGGATRTEHQTAAIEQAHSIAKYIASGETSPPITPFFWSEIFGNRLLVHGKIQPNSSYQILAGEFGLEGFLLGCIKDGKTTALVAWNCAKEFRQERMKLLASTIEQKEL